MSYKYCPHCGGQLPPPINKAQGEAAPCMLPESMDGPVIYNQTVEWKRIVEMADSIRSRNEKPSVLLPSGFTKGRTIIHMVFDVRVSPTGGLMHDLIRSISATQPNSHPRLSDKELETLGYTLRDGKLELVEGVPVGPIYGVLQYWGGEKQHKRWHMSEPIAIDPNRKGDPCFMDENLVALEARWADSSKVGAAINELEKLLTGGIRGTGAIGQPRLIDMRWVR